MASKRRIEREPSKAVHIRRFPIAMYKNIADLAAAEHMSVTTWVIRALEKSVREREREPT